MRLNKYLARAGITSRRKADILIAAGRVSLNGQPVISLGIEVDTDDLVEVDGRPVEVVEELVVYLLHKPAGVISTVSDPRDRQTVVGLIRDPRRLFPIGRLDRNTTGALLITNDGELANHLTHPRYGIEKHYLAEVKGRLSANAMAQLDRGLRVADGFKVRAKVKQVSSRGGRSIYELRLTEGKNREVKRIFRHFQLPLVWLHRTSIAGLTADRLAPGRYRRLKNTEVLALQRAVGGRKELQIP